VKIHVFLEKNLHFPHFHGEHPLFPSFFLVAAFSKGCGAASQRGAQQLLAALRQAPQQGREGLERPILNDGDIIPKLFPLLSSQGLLELP